VTEASTTPRAGGREWIGLAVLGLPTLLVAMDFSILYLATPHLTADLAPSGTQQLWIIDIYGFIIAGFLVTMGTLGDRIGRKKLLLIGAALFGAASLSAAFSVSAEMLIASRAVLGLAGAMVMPSILALVATLFDDPKGRATAIAVYMSCFMGGLTLGPVVGGVLLQYFWWGSAFLVAVPGVAVLLLAGPSMLPEQRMPGAAGKIDLISVAMSLAAILSVVYGLKELARNGWQWSSFVVLVVGLLIAVAFVQRQRTLEHPLLDMRLFSNRTFSSGLTVNFVAGVVGTGTYLVVSLYLQNVAGLSPFKAGLLLVPPAVLMVIGNLVSPALAERVRPAYLIAIGLLISGAGYALFSLSSGRSGWVPMILAWSLAMVGTGPMAALSNQLLMSAAPKDKEGAAASVTQTANELGLGLGIATLGTLATVVYRNHLDGSLGSVPPDAANAARESVDRAIAVAGSLPGGQGGVLVSAARDAFTSGVHAVGIASGIIFALLAGLAAVALRHVQGIQGDAAAAAEEPKDAPADGSQVSANA
jgi:MFS transporter, DHA2 family, multidrug resistance protein